MVEDLERLRILLQTIPKQAGIRVLLANDSEEALRIARTCPGPINLLLTHLHSRKHGGPTWQFVCALTGRGWPALSDAADSVPALLPHPFNSVILLHRVNVLLAFHA